MTPQDLSQTLARLAVKYDLDLTRPMTVEYVSPSQVDDRYGSGFYLTDANGESVQVSDDPFVGFTFTVRPV